MADYNKVNTLYSPIDKVSNQTWSSAAQQKTLDVVKNDSGFCYDLDVAKKESKEPINVHLAVWNLNDCIPAHDKDGNLIYDSKTGEPAKIVASLNHPLSEYDRIIHDSILSLLLAGKTQFTPIDIIRIVTGRVGADERVRPTDEQIKQVHYSICRLSNTRIVLTFENEAVKVSDYKKHFRKKIKDGVDVTYKIDEIIMPIRIASYTENNLSEISYEYIGHIEDWQTNLDSWDNLPALYRYSAPKHQIMNLDLKKKNNVLNVPLSLTVDNEELKIYLNVKINAMKRRNVSNSLHIETILKDLKVINESIDELDKDRRTQIYKKIETLLNYWKDESHYITEWHWKPCQKKNSHSTKDRPLKKGMLVVQPTLKKKK